MAGIENQLGIGMAQVTPRSQSNPMQLVDVYQQAKAGKENQKRYSDAQKSQNEKELYGIIGDTLNPRDFNTAIHGKILQAQRELAQKIKSGTPSYGDTYIMAQNKAAELGKMSQQLNRVDQQIALTKKEYEFDKRINSGAIEMAARNKILNDLETKGSIDETVNYFDEIANDYPEIALIDKSGYTFTDLRPEEKQPLSFNIKKRNPVGRTSAYKWEMDNVPVYYDVIQKGENEAPEVKTRTEPSGFKGQDGQDIPMLSDEAYRRFSLTPSNVFAINQRLKSQYGPDINLKSEQADKLRRIEAFKDVERNKPKPRETILQQDPIIRINTGGSGSSKKETPPWDLTEYPDTEDGGKNLTVPFQGYVVTAIGNNKLLAKNVIYYPQTKQFKVTEYTGRDAEGNPTGEKTSMIKASTFRQNIKGNNPQADMKEFDALVGTEAKGQDTGGGTIKGSEVPKGAKVTQKDGAYYYNGKKII